MMERLALGAIAPLFDGIQFSAGAELLVLIRDYLVDLGWVVETDDPITLLVKGTTDNNHNCWVKFTINIESDRSYLGIQGDLDGTDNILSPMLELDFNLSEVNKVWCFADNDSGGICIRNQYIYSGGVSFGFLERFDETDEYAQMVAFANNKLNDAYVAKSKHNNTNWHRIGDSYSSADIFGSTTMNGPYQGIWDFVVAIALGSFTALSIANAAYYAHQGRVNGLNNLGLITRRWYIEGEENPNNYTSDSQFYCRGFIKHFYNGFAEIEGGGIFEDEQGNKYLSSRSDGWQGLVISQKSKVKSQKSDDLQVVYYGGDNGIEIETSARFISEIRNVLGQIGWVAVQDNIASNGDRTLVMQGQYFDEDEYCYLCVKRVEATNSILVRGELREDSATTGIKSEAFDFANISKIWITANSSAGALIIESGGMTTSLYFGFYGGRIEKSDKYAWGIGVVGNNLDNLLVAKSAFTDENWVSIGEQFNQSNDARSSFPAFSTSDRLSVPLVPFDYYNNEDPRNSAMNGDVQGNINGATGNTQLDFFAVVEGRSNPTDYGANEQFEQKPKALYYRGYIQFACVGKQGKSGDAVFKEGVQIG